MPLTALDPVPALVLVDLQRGIVDGRPGADGLVQRAAALAGAFRDRGLPVVLVNVDGRAPGRTDAGAGGAGAARREGWTELAPELGAAPDDVLITKRTWGAFHGTDLDQRLRQRGVTQVVLGGISTSAGVESTARAAHEHGYHVVLAVDLMLDPDERNHVHSTTRVFPRLGEVTTAGEVQRALAAR